MLDSNSKEVIHILDCIKSKGFIKSETNSLPIYTQQINHGLEKLLKSASIDPTITLACMEKLTAICKKTPGFLRTLSSKMMDLYEQSITGKEFIAKQAETRLLLFFAYVTPDSISEKNRLLSFIERMPDFQKRHNEVARVLSRLVTHYDQEQQFLQDSDTSVIKNLNNLVQKIKITDSRKASCEFNKTKQTFRLCFEMIEKHGLGLHTQNCSSQFSAKKHKASVPKIKDAVETVTLRLHRSFNRYGL